MSSNQQEEPKRPPAQPEQPPQTSPEPPLPPKEPSHDPKVVVTETKGVESGDLQKRTE